MDEQEFKQVYVFDTYCPATKRKHLVQFECEDTVQWSEVLDEFLTWLSSVYGYDIKDRVHYQKQDEYL
jgi:hypothetical protein